jgi:CBS domain-containing protein
MGYVDEPLRVAAYRMSSSQRTQLPVVERRTRKLVGVITLSSLLSARARAYEADTRRRRLLSLHLLSRKESRLEE